MQRRTLIRALIGGALGVVGLPAREAHGQEWIISTIYDAAGRHGVSGDWLLNTAMCESQLDPWAYNDMTGDIGLFQFKPSTWSEWGADPPRFGMSGVKPTWRRGPLRPVCIPTGAAQEPGKESSAAGSDSGTRFPVFRVRATAVELARSGPSRRRGGRAVTSIGERLQQHWLE